MVKSINEIYEKQMRGDVDITDLATVNTESGSIGLWMDMFLDHKVQEQALDEMRSDGHGFLPASWLL
jgi:hypothetical protein